MSPLTMVVAAVLALTVAVDPTLGGQGVGTGTGRPSIRNDFGGNVYGHTASHLYRIDLTGAQPIVSLVGPFGAQITDIARTSDDELFGVSFTMLYRIDRTSGRAQLVGPLGAGNVNALAAVGQRLVAASTDGWLYNVDRTTGRATAVGRFGPGIGSSGDMCLGANGELYLTAAQGPRDATYDVLMRVDLATGAAVALGSTRLNRVYGLACVGGQVLGMTEGGYLSAIDPHTGASAPLAHTQIPFWGGTG